MHKLPLYMNKLQVSIKQLQSTLQANKTKDDSWENVKSLVFNTFEKIKNDYPELHLQTNAGKMIKSVSIGFPLQPIKLSNGGEHDRTIVKTGAIMEVTQTPNGKIRIVEHQPALLENLMDYSENILLSNGKDHGHIDLSDNQNTQELIYEKFADFVDHVNDWETNHSYASSPLAGV